MNLQDAFYEQKFENVFLRAKGDAFQTFFEQLMGLAYKADFMPCRPWGSQGDRKSDGKPWTYLLIPHDVITDNKSLKGLAASCTYPGKSG